MVKARKKKTTRGKKKKEVEAEVEVEVAVDEDAMDVDNTDGTDQIVEPVPAETKTAKKPLTTGNAFATRKEVPPRMRYLLRVQKAKLARETDCYTFEEISTDPALRNRHIALLKSLSDVVIDIRKKAAMPRERVTGYTPSPQQYGSKQVGRAPVVIVNKESDDGSFTSESVALLEALKAQELYSFEIAQKPAITPERLDDTEQAIGFYQKSTGQARVHFGRGLMAMADDFNGAVSD